MKITRDAFLSFSIYGLGLLAILVADIYVSSTFANDKIAEWAFVKSTILIVGTLCLLGYDQVFVRDPKLIRGVWKNFLLQSLAISAGVSFLIMLFKEYPLEKAILLFLSILAFSLLSYLSSASRANFKLWQAQFSINFWKVALLAVLVLIPSTEIVLLFATTIGCTAIISLFLKGYKPSGGFNGPSIENKNARKLGMAFVFTNLTLILAIYGEQFLINLHGDVITSAHLFHYFSVYTPIALSINGFLGFYFAPKIRRAGTVTVSQFKTISGKFLIFSSCITLISVMFGTLYFIWIKAYSLDTIDYVLVFFLATICLTRGVYTAGSVCLGVFGTAKQLQKASIFCIGITIIYTILISIVLKTTSGIQAAQMISACSLLNWLLRLVIFNYFTYQALNNAHDGARS